MQPMPVSMRERILQLYEQGKSTQEISGFSGYCVVAVRPVRQQYRDVKPH